MLRQVEELASNDAQTSWKVGMQWCSDKLKDWHALLLRQVEGLACNDARLACNDARLASNDAQASWRIGMQWCSGANVDSSFLLENLLETQCVERMKSKGRKLEMKTFAVCSGESQPIFTTPCLQSLLNSAPFDEKGSARCDVLALGWKVEKKTLIILWFGFDLLYFKWVYRYDFFVIARSARSELT